jgi:hypothetical protein
MEKKLAIISQVVQEIVASPNRHHEFYTALERKNNLFAAFLRM